MRSTTVTETAMLQRHANSKNSNSITMITMNDDLTAVEEIISLFLRCK